jgi:arginine/lysine/histidine/glutamine transport system substrate-binding and permease protein
VGSSTLPVLLLAPKRTPDPKTSPGRQLHAQTESHGAIRRFLVVTTLPALFQGALVTLLLTVVSAILGLVGETLLGIVRLSSTKPLRWVARADIDFFRGMPLLVQIFIVFLSSLELALQ